MRQLFFPERPAWSWSVFRKYFRHLPVRNGLLHACCYGIHKKWSDKWVPLWSPLWDLPVLLFVCYLLLFVICYCLLFVVVCYLLLFVFCWFCYFISFCDLFFYLDSLRSFLLKVNGLLSALRASFCKVALFEEEEKMPGRFLPGIWHIDFRMMFIRTHDKPCQTPTPVYLPGSLTFAYNNTWSGLSCTDCSSWLHAPFIFCLRIFLYHT